MSEQQRMAAAQLAAALRDAMPRGTFDERRFLATVLDDAAPPE